MARRQDERDRPFIADFIQGVMMCLGGMVGTGGGWFWAGSISRYFGMSTSSALAWGLWIGFAVSLSAVGWWLGQRVVRLIWG